MGVKSHSVSTMQVVWDMVLSLGEYFLKFWWRLLDPEYEGSTVFQIVRNFSTNYTPSLPGWYEFSVSLLWQLHISPDLARYKKNFLCGLFNDAYGWNYIVLNCRLDSEGQKSVHVILLGRWARKENSAIHTFYVLCGCSWWLGRNALHEACHNGKTFKFIWQCAEHFKTNY
jgi:hypothetical protein